MVLALRTNPALAVAKVARSCDKARNDYTRKHLLTGDSGFVMIPQHQEDTSPQHTHRIPHQRVSLKPLTAHESYLRDLLANHPSTKVAIKCSH